MAKLQAFVILALVAVASARIAPKADCTWSVNNDLPNNQALYIKPGGSLDLKGFWLPQSGDIVSVPAGDQVLFACPGSQLSAVGAPEAVLTCVGGTQYESETGQTYSFSQLGCSSNPFHDARRTGRSCEIPGPYSLIEIGFELSNGDFYTIIEVCFNDATSDTLYTKFTQTPEIDGYQSGYPRPGFVQGSDFYPSDMDVDNQYSRDGQLAAVAKAVGSTSLAGQYIQSSGDYFLSRGHMTAKADFVYGAHHRATFWFLNVAPQWQTFNGANWNTLEMNTRTYAATKSGDLTVYTGSHGTTTLADVNGNEVPIYIAYDANDNGLLRVPHIYWKVVHEPSTGLGVAFIGLNNPYIDNPGSDFYLCPDVCGQISWINWDQQDQKKGYSYCCEVDALAAVVEEVPALTVTGLLV